MSHTVCKRYFKFTNRIAKGEHALRSKITRLNKVRTTMYIVRTKYELLCTGSEAKTIITRQILKSHNNDRAF